MSKTPQYVEEHGGEKVVDATDYTIYEDCDGDYWICQNGESVLIASTRRDEFSEGLGDAGLLPEKYTPDEDPSPSPEEVSLTWIAARETADSDRTVYFPKNGGTEITYREGRTFPFRVKGEGYRHGTKFSDYADTSVHAAWNASVVETIDAEEVPADE